jgi:hypothetical protein
LIAFILRHLQERLAAGTDLEVTLFYIDKFGTPALLPDVIARYQPHEGKWACEPQKFILRYWLRCDPKAGTEALSRALQARASTGCYKMLLDGVLTDQWNDAALPVVVQALDDPNNEVVLSAIKVLGVHGDSAAIDKCIATLEKINAATKPASVAPGTIVRGQASFVARQMLDNKSAHYTPEQQQSLEALDKGQ